jgi:hypothetical protein
MSLTKQDKHKEMKFFFILNCSIKNISQSSLRVITIILSIIMLIIEVALLIAIIDLAQGANKDITFEIGYQSILIVLWMLMLTGPLIQNFNFCYVTTIILEICTLCDFVFKIYFAVKTCLNVHLSKDYVYNIILVLVIFIYLTIWFESVYFYFSYTKSLRQGQQVTTDVNKDETRGAYIPPKEDFSAKALNAHLSIQHCSTLEIRADNTLGKENMVFDAYTPPPGIVIPGNVDV